MEIEALRIAELSEGGEPAAPASVQFLFALEGELILTAGDRELRAPTGSWVELPPDGAHAVSARAPVRYLEITPSRG